MMNCFVECLGGRYDGAQYTFNCFPLILKVVRKQDEGDEWRPEVAEYYVKHVAIGTHSWFYKVISEGDYFKRMARLGK